MKTNDIQNRLVSLVRQFSDLKLFIVGDVILDHYIWGEVSRISPEAPVVVVAVRREEYSLGGAANVAKNVISLGAQASLAGTLGKDRFGEQLLELLQEQKIDTVPLVQLEDRTTTVKSRVIARAQQVVRVDRESDDHIPQTAQAMVAKKIEQALADCSGVIVSDYAKGVITEQTYAPLATAFARGAFSFSRPLVVDPKNANFPLYKGATVVKPNRSEAEAASRKTIRSQQDAIEAARTLLPMWGADSVLITLGEMGMVSVARDESIEPVAVPTQAREVYDVSGAGDTVAAVYGLALAAGATLKEAAQVANIAAGVVVAEIGAVAITTEELLEAIDVAARENRFA